MAQKESKKTENKVSKKSATKKTTNRQAKKPEKATVKPASKPVAKKTVVKTQPKPSDKNKSDLSTKSVKIVSEKSKAPAKLEKKAIERMNKSRNGSFWVKFLTSVIIFLLILVIVSLVGISYYRSTADFAYREMYLGAKDEDTSRVLGYFDTRAIAEDLIDSKVLTNGEDVFASLPEDRRELGKLEQTLGLESSIKVFIEYTVEEGIFDELLPYEVKDGYKGWRIEDLDVDKDKFKLDIEVPEDGDWSEYSQKLPIARIIKRIVFEKNRSSWKAVEFELDMSALQPGQ